MTKPQVLIIGAGIGGLTAAIALLDRGFSVEVHEQAAALGEIGAGVTISTGAQRVFGSLGLLPEIRSKASIMRSLVFVHYATGEFLDGAPDHGDGTVEAGRPANIHIHRADLHDILSRAFLARPGASLFLSHRLTGLDESADSVRVDFADGSHSTGDLVVGADGLRSATRTVLWGQGEPRFAGQVAYRALIPHELAAPFVAKAGRTVLYFGPDRVFHRYSLRAGGIVNCVALARTESWKEEGYTTAATSAELLDLYAGWHPDVLGLMRVAPPAELKKWALYDREPLGRWRQGRVTLLGDAAHPMLPFLGLGSAMAIEDGLVLARALAAQPSVAGLDRYEQLRRPRTNEVMVASKFEGSMVQGRDPADYDPDAAPSHSADLYDFDPEFALG